MTGILVALAVAAAAVALRALAVRRAREDRRRLADPSLLERYARLPAEAVPFVRMGLLGFGILALALASRHGGDEATRTDAGGAETILLLDASNSMLAEDVEPNRLHVQRELAGRLATRLQGQMGVVYFAGRAYVLSPLTTDLNAVEMLVEGVRPAAVGLGGSSIAIGLTQAIDLLAGGRDDAAKRIVLFSDGEATVEQSVGDAIDRAREAGIAIHAVGIGTEAGAQIPLTREASLDPSTAARRRGGSAVLQGPDGRPVVTRLEEGALREIASETGGRYVNAASGVGALEQELTAGSTPPAPGGNAGVGLLLFFAFLALWGEGFLLPRG